MKIQELNEDGSPRLDDLGQPIYQYLADMAYYELMETPIGQKRWRRVDEKKEPLKESKPVTTKSHK